MLRRELTGIGVVIAIAVILISVLYFVFFPSRNDTTLIKLNGTQIRAVIANTEEDRITGLSATPTLPADRGMLFIFPSDGYWGIWMKDMKYSLDIIWLNDQKSVVHIEDFVEPSSYPHTFVPRVPSRYVLEVQSGIATRYNLQVGDKLEFDIGR